MTDLVLGPLLRTVAGAVATVWVQTDGPGRVRVEAGPATGEAETFAVAGRHYALVTVNGLPPAATSPYRVLLDGETVWPQPTSELPPPAIRTSDAARPVRVVFGSCRVEAPDAAPWNLPREEDAHGHGVDALETLALRIAADPGEPLPDLLALLGDQVYADLVVTGPLATRRRPGGPPPGSVADLDDYAEIYRRAWTHPGIRWLLSTVPSVMLFDDHDVVDDWNTSAAWLADIQEQPWWEDRIRGGLTAYWLYQHLGNLTPAEQAADPVVAAVMAAPDRDATAVLAENADRWRLERADATTCRWSTVRDVDGAARIRLVSVDTRNSRQLEEAHRAIVDDEELAWVAERCREADVDHLLLGSSLPWLLPEGVHDLERWGAALGHGRWGRPGRALAEKARRAGDLEHWASFGDSFDDLAGILREVASQPDRRSPSSALVLSGDVHFSYVAPVRAPPGATRIVQLVCSPFRNGVPPTLERALKFASSRVGALGGRIGRRTAQRDEEPIAWDVDAGPWFGNTVATLTFAGREASVRFERSRLDHDGRPDLVTIHDARLAGP